MWAHANVCVSAILLIIYIFIFGQQSINKYTKKGVIIVSDEEKTDSILAPGIYLKQVSSFPISEF